MLTQQDNRLIAWMAVVVVGLISVQAIARERVLHFNSRVEIASDGAMTVTETVKVTVEGKLIVHGIYRDFPTRYKDRYGNAYEVSFRLLGTTMDGRPVSNHTRPHGNGVRIYLGDSATTVPKGVHRYTLTYHTNYQLGFFKDHDAWR